MRTESNENALLQVQLESLRATATKNLNRIKTDIPDDTRCSEKVMATYMIHPDTDSRYSRVKLAFSSQENEITVPFAQNSEQSWKGIAISTLDELMIAAAIKEKEKWQASLDSEKVNEVTKKNDRTYITYLNTLIESIESGTIKRLKTAPFTMLYFVKEEFEKFDKNSKEVEASSERIGSRIRHLFKKLFN